MKTNNDVQFPMERQIFQMIHDNQSAYKSLVEEYNAYKETVKQQADKLSSMISGPKRDILRHLAVELPGNSIKLGQKDQTLQIQVDGASLKIKAKDAINSPNSEGYLTFQSLDSPFDAPETILGWKITVNPSQKEIAKAINTLHELQSAIEAVSSRFPAVYQEALNYMMTDVKNEAEYFSDLSQRIKNYQNPLREFEKENDKDSAPELDPNIIDDLIV